MSTQVAGDPDGLYAGPPDADPGIYAGGDKRLAFFAKHDPHMVRHADLVPAADFSCKHCMAL